MVQDGGFVAGQARYCVVETSFEGSKGVGIFQFCLFRRMSAEVGGEVVEVRFFCSQETGEGVLGLLMELIDSKLGTGEQDIGGNAIEFEFCIVGESTILFETTIDGVIEVVLLFVELLGKGAEDRSGMAKDRSMGQG